MKMKDRFGISLFKGIFDNDLHDEWGIGLRAAGIFPDIFVAFFYSGLGCALALAGVMFTKNYFCHNQLIGKEQAYE